jgi:hypothetical protein
MRKALLLLLLFTGCYKGHLYVQQETVDKNYLASTWTKTPDYRADTPPYGQNLLVAWDFPLSTYRRELALDITVRFWDNTEAKLVQKLGRRRGSNSFFYPNPGHIKEKKILTYKIDVVAGDGEIIEVWKHQLWTELISVDSTNSSVSFQPKQESVIEVP